MEKFLKSIQLSDLDDEQREMAELIGLDSYKMLVENYGGTRPYIPKPEGVGKAHRNDSIREQFNGYNFRELAMQFNLTEVTIRYIVADLVRTIRRKPIDCQITLFD